MDEWVVSPESDVGYSAPVHHSVIEPLRIMGAPYRAAGVNFFAGFVMTFGGMLKHWPIIAVAAHVLLWLCTRGDIFRLEIFRRAVGQDSYMDVG